MLELLEQLVETWEYKEISAIKQPLWVIKFVLYWSTKGKCAQLHHWTGFKRDVHDHRYDLNLQLADLIVWEYKKLYFFDDINYLDDSIQAKNLDNKKT